jgi:hypothetical protein
MGWIMTDLVETITLFTNWPDYKFIHEELSSLTTNAATFLGCYEPVAVLYSWGSER